MRGYMDLEGRMKFAKRAVPAEPVSWVDTKELREASMMVLCPQAFDAPLIESAMRLDINKRRGEKVDTYILERPR